MVGAKSPLKQGQQHHPKCLEFSKKPVLIRLWKRFVVLQISAKRGSDLKFEVEANSKVMVPIEAKFNTDTPNLC